MKKIFFIVLVVGSLNAMDADAQWKAQIAREQQHEDVLRSFEEDVFQRKKLSRSEVETIVQQLQGLRSTAGYNYLMDRALLALSKKSKTLGNLGDELKVAQILISAGAKIKYKRDAVVPYSGPLTETGAAPFGHKAKLIKESTYCLATGDLRDLFDQIEAGQ